MSWTENTHKAIQTWTCTYKITVRKTFALWLRLFWDCIVSTSKFRHSPILTPKVETLSHPDSKDSDLGPKDRALSDPNSKRSKLRSAIDTPILTPSPTSKDLSSQINLHRAQAWFKRSNCEANGVGVVHFVRASGVDVPVGFLQALFSMTISSDGNAWQKTYLRRDA